MAYLRMWRKRKADINELLQSDDDNNDVTIENAVMTNAREDTTNDDGGSSTDDQSTSVTTDGSCFDTDIGLCDSDVEILNPEPEAQVSNLGKDLREWSTRHQISNRSLNELLQILRHHGHVLPKDARTLLATPQVIDSHSKCNGQYIYYGLEGGISRVLCQNDAFRQQHSTVSLDVNIDGLPIFKSSKVQFWPILVKLSNFNPFIVALYCGESKPEPLEEYLHDFLKELKNLTQNGLVIHEKKFAVNIRTFLCDAPARAYLKCIKGHTAYDSCERCEVKGQYVERRVVFNQLTSTLRTDEAFSQIQYSHHQNGCSPLIAAGIPCVSGFVLDYMHMICLGVVRRLLVYLTRGPKLCRLSVRQKSEISQKLNMLRGQMPSEFARQPRGLQELDRWKATEFRQFLLYTGPIVLKNTVSSQLYAHFVTLTVAVSIMLDSDDRTRAAYLEYATELMRHFVSSCTALYGKTFTVYNVHALLHIHEDVSHFRCSLNDICCFPFENYLQQIKRLVRTGQNPLAQVSKRLVEIEHAQGNSSAQPEVKPQMYISTKRRDSCFLLEDERFAFVQERRGDGTVVCDVIKLRHTVDLFDKPCLSKLLNIAYIGNGRRFQRQEMKEKDLARKVACLPFNNGSVMIPLRHGIEHSW
ncbi:uncharacterized protein [Misgurnus anguillicaudatus]|uniref:uncharacterized protein isoform X1 n=1 Tax=Misgurnus anguillicaudatus TaxID=75329 RepID=UPI003CCF9902